MQLPYECIASNAVALACFSMTILASSGTFWLWRQNKRQFGIVFGLFYIPFFLFFLSTVESLLYLRGAFYFFLSGCIALAVALFLVGSSTFTSLGDIFALKDVAAGEKRGQPIPPSQPRP